jgi:preprotein translocase subunit SecD
MRRTDLYMLVGIIVLTVFSAWVVWPQRPDNYLPPILDWPDRGWILFDVGDFHFERQGMTLGLDLQGGTHLVLEADLSDVNAQERDSAVEGAVKILERRINAFGVAEPIIFQQGADRIVVQLPGVRDIARAKDLIGRTAQLSFREFVFTEEGEGEWVPATATGRDGVERQLTGEYFNPNAAVTFNQNTGSPEVAFEFDDEGAYLFEQITARLIDRPLGIFLDDELISAPTVQAVISKNGIITGVPLDEASVLAIQLNAGALPVPISIIQESSVDAVLGSDSIRKSILAGEIGLGLVFLFMILYYRLPGVLAGIALVIYTMVVLAIFKLWPVTLTLAGIAAFILSIGMAVDANILIFERMKEEVRAGRTLARAVDEGFNRAWPSIRDSNVSTFITCGILYWFGSNFGASLVMGFAVTLFIGVAVSMFTAIVITRTLLRIVLRWQGARNPALLGLVVEEVA